MKSITIKQTSPIPASPSRPPTKLDKFLRGHGKWPSYMRRLAARYAEQGHLKAIVEAAMAHKHYRDGRILGIAARLERIECDPATIVSIAAIARSWIKHPYSCGDVAVVTDKALDSRHFPLVPQDDNMIFPDLALFRPVLEAAGLPADFRDSNGNPLHFVFGVLLQSWFEKGRARNEFECAVESVDAAHLPQFPDELTGQFVSPEWIQSVFAPFAVVKKPKKGVSRPKRSKAEAKIRHDSIGTIASLIRSNMMALCAAREGVFFTSADVLAAGNSLGIFNLVRFGSERDGIHRIARALGPEHLNLPWARHYGARRWFLPAVTMRDRIKQEFLNLDWDEMLKACSYAFWSFASAEEGMKIPEELIDSWDRYWLSLVPVADENQPFVVSALRQYLEPNEFPSLIVGGVMFSLGASKLRCLADPD